MTQDVLEKTPAARTRKKICVLCCEGFYQSEIIYQLSSRHEVTGIVWQRNTAQRASPAKRARKQLANPAGAVRHLIARSINDKNQRAIKPFIDQYFASHQEHIKTIEKISQTYVKHINDAETIKFVQVCKPDFICVNGTQLLNEELLRQLNMLVGSNIINLHTGLSPYSRGGNCNLFMLLEKRPELIGITVHYIDQGIDSGDIIFTRRPELTASDTMELIDAKCWSLGIKQLVRSIATVDNKNAPRIEQWEQGKLFLAKTGYRFNPSLYSIANRLIKSGLIRDYLANKTERDKDVRLVGGNTTTARERAS